MDRPNPHFSSPPNSSVWLARRVCAAVASHDGRAAETESRRLAHRSPHHPTTYQSLCRGGRGWRLWPPWQPQRGSYGATRGPITHQSTRATRRRHLCLHGAHEALMRHRPGRAKPSGRPPIGTCVPRCGLLPILLPAPPPAPCAARRARAGRPASMRGEAPRRPRCEGAPHRSRAGASPPAVAPTTRLRARVRLSARVGARVRVRARVRARVRLSISSPSDSLHVRVQPPRD